MRFARRLLVTALLAAAGALQLAPAAGGAQYVYVANDDVPGTLSGFAVSPTTGGLTPVPGTPPAIGAFPISTVISPDAKHVYAGSFGIYGFDIGADGSLTAMPGSPFQTTNSFDQLAISPDGSHLFGAGHFSNNVFAFDLAANGVPTQVAGSPFAAGNTPDGLALTPDARHLYAANANSANISAYNVAADGSLTQVTGSPFAAGTGPQFAGVTPDGRHLYAANFGSSNVSGYTIAADGSLSAVAGSPFAAGSQAWSATSSPDGAHVYVGNQGSSNISAYNVAASGALSAVTGSPFSAGAGATGTRVVALNPAGKELFAASFSTSKISAAFVGTDGSLGAVTGSPFASGSGATGVAVTPDQVPTAAFSPTIADHRDLTFDSSASTDPDGTVRTYFWDFGDGTTAQGDFLASPAHTFAADGVYDVTLRVADDQACSTAVVYTGQTVACNGKPSASLTQAVRVDTKVDGAKVKAKKKQRQKRGKIVVKFKAGAAEDVQVEVRRAQIAVPGKAPIEMAKLPRKPVTAGKLKKFKLKPKRSKDAKAVFAALGKGKKVKAAFRVRFRDVANNLVEKPVTVKLK